jgi:hypothetical protein
MAFFFSKYLHTFNVCSHMQSTNVLCPGMEIPANPATLVSIRKLLPGLNDDLQRLSKEWLL